MIKAPAPSSFKNFKVQYWIPAQLVSPALLSSHGSAYKKIDRLNYRVTEYMTAQQPIDIIKDIALRGGTVIRMDLRPDPLISTVFITKDYKQQFLRSLRFNTDVGMSAGKALEQVILSETNPKYRLKLNPALMVVRRGGAFSDAIELVSMYGRATIAVLRAGEQTGKMNSAIQAALTQFQRGQYLMLQLKGLMAWLSFDLFGVISTLISVRMWMLPFFAKSLNGKANAEALLWKIWTARIVMDVFLGIALIATVVGGGALFLYYVTKNAELKEKLELTLYKIPIVATFFLSNALAESMAITASMLRGGVTLMEALDISRESTAFPVVRRYWTTVTDRLMLGQKPPIAVAIAPLESTERLIVSSHKNTLQLAEVFENIAERRTEASTRAAQKIRSLLIYGSILYIIIPILVVMWVLSGVVSNLSDFASAMS